jgi:hypothetical protein
MAPGRISTTGNFKQGLPQFIGDYSFRNMGLTELDGISQKLPALWALASATFLSCLAGLPSS